MTSNNTFLLRENTRVEKERWKKARVEEEKRENTIVQKEKGDRRKG